MSADVPSRRAAREESGTGLTLFGTWQVGDADQQQAAVDAIAASWRGRPWPAAGLRAYEVLAGDEGGLLLHVSRWADADPDHAVLPDTSWKDEVDRAVPGIRRMGVVGCLLHRSRLVEEYGRTPGCVVLVTRVFDGPQPERARRLVDALVDSTAEAPAPAGMLSARFYVSLDGRYVYNLAEWRDAEAHQAALTRAPHQAVDRARWQQVHAWPGLTNTTFARFRPALRLTAGERDCS